MTRSRKSKSKSKSSTKNSSIQESSKNSSNTKGILKSSLESRNKRRRKKTTTFDEENIAVTYHPLNKDYGHDKISEALTPFFRSPEQGKYSTPIDARLLSEKLTNLISSGQTFDRNEDIVAVEDEDHEETFQNKMRQHYQNEFIGNNKGNTSNKD